MVDSFQLSVVDSFGKNFHLRCPTRFWVHLWNPSRIDSFLGFCQTSMIELLWENGKELQTVTYFCGTIKSTIKDVWQGLKYSYFLQLILLTQDMLVKFLLEAGTKTSCFSLKHDREFFLRRCISFFKSVNQTWFSFKYA